MRQFVAARWFISDVNGLHHRRHRIWLHMKMRNSHLSRRIRRLEQSSGVKDSMPFIAYCLTPRQFAATQEEVKQHRRSYVIGLTELISDEVWDHYAPYRNGEVDESPDPWPEYEYPLATRTNNSVG